MASLTPNADQLTIDPKAARLSIEYAKARSAINEDFKLMFASNQAMAKRVRRESKAKVVDFLGGKVSRNEKDHLIVAFMDGSVARL